MVAHIVFFFKGVSVCMIDCLKDPLEDDLLKRSWRCLIALGLVLMKGF